MPMARPLRIEYPGALYHVTSRGNGGNPIYRNDPDRFTFLRILKEVNDRFHWICHTYCLMDNHYHLIIETPEGNLSQGMRHLNGVYTMKFNWRHKTIGHVFQGRFKAVLVQKESHFLEACRYVVLNPVRSQIVERPEDWASSSFRAFAGKGKANPCLTLDSVLAHFGERQKIASERYMNFVKEGMKAGRIWDEVKGQILLGDETFFDRFIDHIKGYEKIKEVPRSQRYLSRPRLEQLFPQREAEDKKKRNAKISDAVRNWGYTQKEVADFLRMHYSTVSRLIAKGSEKSKNKT